MTSGMRLLLISNSTNAGEEYLAYPIKQIGEFLKDVKKVLFIPYAGVTGTWDEYEAKVQNRFNEIGIAVEGIHHCECPIQAVEKAEALVVGGGNTWRLLQEIQRNNLIPAVAKRVAQGMPYVGWSAGSNVACPSIKTTNDMPIVQPDNFHAFSLVPFQINPHYLDANPDGHAGETRETRILEFLEMNQHIYVVGLREGTMLQIEDQEISLLGTRPARVFKYGFETSEVQPGGNFKFLAR